MIRDNPSPSYILSIIALLIALASHQPTSAFSPLAQQHHQHSTQHQQQHKHKHKHTHRNAGHGYGYLIHHTPTSNPMQTQTQTQQSKSKHTHIYNPQYITSTGLCSTFGESNLPEQDVGVIVPQDGFGSPCVIKVSIEKERIG